MKRAAIAIAILAVLGGGAAMIVRDRGGPPSDDVPTATVTRGSFERRVHAEGNLRAVKATPLVAPRAAGSFGPVKIAWLAPDGSRVKAGDVVVRFDPTDPEKQLRDGEADLDSANAKLHKETIKSQAAVRDRQTDAALAADELDKTRKLQAKDEMIFSRNQIIESQIDEKLAGAKQEHATSAEKIERSLSQSNAAVIGVERQKAELAISHAKSALKQMEIVAPNDGIFVLQRDWRGAVTRLGDSLWPGQRVAEIPLLDAMEVEVYVLEVEGSGLAEKQTAEIRIEARPELQFAGKIRFVDKLAQPRQPGSPVQYFAVTVALDKTDLAVMKPGQRVLATLVLDQEAAIAVPRGAVIDKDGKTVVYRRGGQGFEPVAVELGASTSGRVVIKKGLADGDVIALRDPTRRLDQVGSGSGSAKAAAP